MLFRNFFIALLVTVSINAAHAAPRWLSLPPTPTLSKAAQSGFAGFFAPLVLPLPLGQRPVEGKAGRASGAGKLVHLLRRWMQSYLVRFDHP